MASQQPDKANPYASPTAPSTPGPQASLGQQPGRCPKCGSSESKMPGFTWWGGAIGQHVLSHVKCLQCGTGYNSKTGGSNTVAIIIYQVVLLAIIAGIFVALKLNR